MNAVIEAVRSAARAAVMRAEELGFAHAARPRLRGRVQLAALLNARGLLGTGVEVGVFAGEFSDYLLTHWRGRKLISIDPWQHWDAGYVDSSNRSAEEMEALHRTVSRRLQRHGERSEIWRTTSEAAARRIADASLDFVYLDAQHHAEAVRQDLRAWLSKLRPGALFAGHDYLDGEGPAGIFGVKTAVDEFVRENGLTLHITRSEAWPTWFLFKPAT
ncbi:MAG: class I SAM-dependent methyltransferase [Verrucomicrobia bacterium]|nr:class I SAM-dependent methyltransferase [Verrucomicrobiota bacterium]